MLDRWRIAKLMTAGTALMLCQACASLGTYQSARTLEKGKTEFELRPQFQGGAITSTSAENTGSAGTYPALDVYVRHGLTGNADLGIKLGLTGLNVDTKIQLSRNDSLALALDPSIGGIIFGLGGTSFTYLNLGLPLLVGKMLSPTSELTFAPRIDYSLYRFASSGESAQFSYITAGVSFGLTQEFSPTFHVHPEITLGYPVIALASESVEGNTISGSGGGLLFNIGIGVDFGGGYGK